MIRSTIKRGLKRGVRELIHLPGTVRSLLSPPTPASWGGDSLPARPNDAPPTSKTSQAGDLASTDAQGRPLNAEAVEEILNDMVRPALEGDGGSIELVKLDGSDIHVRLTGACQACPSADITLRMGVEALLREEFPTMGRLVDVR